MSIKNILVAYSGTDSSKSAVRLAKTLMQKFDAHLTGALTFSPSEISTTLRPYANPELTQAIVEAETGRRNTVHAEFFSELGLPEGDKVHWVENGGDVDFSLMELARTYDLVVMGQYDGTRENRNLVPHPDVIALHSGRPVLVVPAAISEQALNGKIALAWDGGRSAARAMADAIDILESDCEVVLISVGEGNAETVGRLDKVASHLKRHGIECESEIVPRAHQSVANVLMQTVETLGAGLLVMGAYEHSKFAETLWGGVTHSILAKANVPVLMSH